jgi:DNA mismatch repair protein PMS2
MRLVEDIGYYTTSDTAADTITKATVSVTGSNAQKRMRTELSSFARQGSQAQPIAVDDDDSVAEEEASGAVDDVDDGDEVLDVQFLEEGSSRLSIPDTEISSDGELLASLAKDDAAAEPAASASNYGDASSSGEVDKELDVVNDDDLPEVVKINEGITFDLAFDLDSVTALWDSKARRRTESQSQSDELSAQLDATTDRTEDDDTEEAQLSRIVHKRDFASMEIVGQFNRGFIIARLKGKKRAGDENDEMVAVDDLFIIDQHAADEKYNFETLQETTKIESQKLLQ